MARGVPVCEACGYELSGVALDGRQARCPECGAWFTAQCPFVLYPWFPAAVWAVVPLCGPTLMVMAAVAWIAESSAARPGLAVAMPLVVLIWFFAALALPALVAGKLVKRRVLRTRRTRAGTVIALVAVAVNIAISAAVLAWLG